MTTTTDPAVADYLTAALNAVERVLVRSRDDPAHPPPCCSCCQSDLIHAKAALEAAIRKATPQVGA